MTAQPDFLLQGILGPLCGSRACFDCPGRATTVHHGRRLITVCVHACHDTGTSERVRDALAQAAEDHPVELLAEDNRHLNPAGLSPAERSLVARIRSAKQRARHSPIDLELLAGLEQELAALRKRSA